MSFIVEQMKTGMSEYICILGFGSLQTEHTHVLISSLYVHTHNRSLRCQIKRQHLSIVTMCVSFFIYFSDLGLFFDMMPIYI